ncbi:MAG: glycosyltransferase family 2 protein, partial [Gammaproteobacteria bacterium]|nr:glycosyltransferase family 2 protein [Gammaproteobacteria bacterium]
MADPLVSICMPLYNTERFVGDAIRGVLNQTYRNFELIVCDNGSTDRSVAIVEEFAAKDPRIRLCRNRRNLGYAGNLHKVTSLALGEFMIVHCADDLAEPGAIETMVRLATQPGVDRDNVVVLSDTFVAEAEGRRIGVHRQRPGGFDLMHQELDEYRSDGSVERFRGRTALKYALPRLAIVGWLGATFYSRRLFESIEGVYNGLLYTPDLQLNYHLMSRDPEVLWIREPLFSWRLHESGHIGKARAEAVPSHAWDGYTYTFHFPP